ncbi:MAG: lycopene cyclase domain-containing protein [Actinomycetota bacterium]|jgi:lycopene cyclase domain-containing protein
MIYSDIAITAFAIAVMADLFLFKNSLLTRPAFWTSYAIILPFQLITNWWLTSKNIVMYNPDAIVGLRIFSAPAEDLLFGFALIVGVMDMWEFWGRRGMQRDPNPNKKNNK